MPVARSRRSRARGGTESWPRGRGSPRGARPSRAQPRSRAIVVEDASAQASMKSAASCETSCDTQDLANHRILERPTPGARAQHPAPRAPLTQRRQDAATQGVRPWRGRPLPPLALARVRGEGSGGAAGVGPQVGLSRRAPSASSTRVGVCHAPPPSLSPCARLPCPARASSFVHSHPLVRPSFSPALRRVAPAAEMQAGVCAEGRKGGGGGVRARW